MAVELISKIKPKNNGSFAMVDSVDVEMPDGTRLNTLHADLQSAKTDPVTGETYESITARLNASSQASDGINTEVVNARKVGTDGTTYTNLKERLDANSDSIDANTSAISAASKNKTDNVTFNNLSARLENMQSDINANKTSINDASVYDSATFTSLAARLNAERELLNAVITEVENAREGDNIYGSLAARLEADSTTFTATNNEVVNARTDGDNTTYTTLGNRLNTEKNQFDALKSEVENARSAPRDTSYPTLGARINALDTEIKTNASELFSARTNVDQEFGSLDARLDADRAVTDSVRNEVIAARGFPRDTIFDTIGDRINDLDTSIRYLLYEYNNSRVDSILEHTAYDSLAERLAAEMQYLDKEISEIQTGFMLDEITDDEDDVIITDTEDSIDAATPVGANYIHLTVDEAMNRLRDEIQTAVASLRDIAAKMMADELIDVRTDLDELESGYLFDELYIDPAPEDPESVYIEGVDEPVYPDPVIIPLEDREYEPLIIWKYVEHPEQIEYDENDEPIVIEQEPVIQENTLRTVLPYGSVLEPYIQLILEPLRVEMKGRDDAILEIAREEMRNQLNQAQKEYVEHYDWSNKDHLTIPEPRLAVLNFSNVGELPTTKTENKRVWVEFWDLNGNYFRKRAIVNAQGNSSMAFIKKNFSIDLFNDDFDGDDPFMLRIGNWVAQDSFHLKAYYTDFFRGVSVISYKLYDQMVKTRGIKADRPWKKALINFDNITTESSTTGVDPINGLDLQLDNGAKNFPLGFPCIVLLNGEFYGIYAFNIKKHRDNYHMIKDNPKNIHLDGSIDSTTIFGANGDTSKIKWIPGSDAGFEIRNPKSLVTMSGAKYNSDSTSSQELIDSTSEAYIAENSKHVLSAQVKSYIVNLSTYITQLSDLETELTTKVTNEEITSDDLNASMRAKIEEFFDPENIIDYMLETSLVRDTDGYRKNWQWTTYDGVKWYVNPYDMDGIFGAYHIGNYTNPAPNSANLLNTSTALPNGWVYKYYKAEIKQRWNYLKDAGIFTVDNIMGIMTDWLDRIGTDNFEREYEKWPESPCNRSSNINGTFWTLSGKSYITTGWDASTTYAENALVIRSKTEVINENTGETMTTRKVYKSKTSNNLGNDPFDEETSSEYWDEVSYIPTKNYAVGDTCYYGGTMFYKFTAKVASRGRAPFTALYETYPYEMGHKDNIYRVYNWLTKVISGLDTNINNL